MGFLSGGALAGLGRGISGAGEAVGAGIMKMGELKAEQQEKDLAAQREINLERWKKKHGHSSYQTKTSDATTASGWKLKDAASAVRGELKNYFGQETGALDWGSSARSDYESRSDFMNRAITNGVEIDGENVIFATPAEANRAYSQLLDREKGKAKALAQEAAVSDVGAEEGGGVLDWISKQIDDFAGTLAPNTAAGSGLRILLGVDEGSVTPEMRQQWARSGEKADKILKSFTGYLQRDKSAAPEAPAPTTAPVSGPKIDLSFGLSQKSIDAITSRSHGKFTLRTRDGDTRDVYWDGKSITEVTK